MVGSDRQAEGGALTIATVALLHGIGVAVGVGILLAIGVVLAVATLVSTVLESTS